MENRIENTLYQVVDFSENGVYLQNTDTNEIFEETELSDDLMDLIQNDSILRFIDGDYIIEEELTEEFMNSMLGIKEFRDMQSNFIENSGINENDVETTYVVNEINDDYLLLSYSDGDIQVPRPLTPFFINIGDSLKFIDGKFQKC